MSGRSLTFSLLALLVLVAPPMARPAAALSYFGLVDTGELFASTDGGASWVIRSTLPVSDAVGLLAGSSSSQLFLAARSGSFYRSVDAGVVWSAIAAVPAADVAAIVPYPGRLLLLTRTGGIYASLDAGATFTAIGTITAPDVVAGARLGTSVFALSKSGGVYRSTDAGVGWSAVGSIGAPDLAGLAAYKDRLYALTGSGDVARSSDEGASWSFVGTLSQVGMTALLATPAELVATTGAGEVAASADGIAWAWRGVINQLTVRALASDQPFPTSVGVPEPMRLEFRAPWPNPVRDRATLAFELAVPAVVTVAVHDLAGREVARPLHGETLNAGPVERAWDASALAAGVYFLRARMGDREQVRRIVLLGGP